MINQGIDPVSWSLLIQELEDLREHVDSLAKQMVQDGRIDDEDFAIQIGHAYAHLNRAWNSRCSVNVNFTEEQWELLSQFPKDLEPQ